MTTRVDPTKFPRIKMEIEEFISDRPKRGRRGSPAIPEGYTLYAIKYVGYVGYYTYSYVNRKDAEECIENMRIQQTDNSYYYPWNVVKDKQDTLHYGVRPVKPRSEERELWKDKYGDKNDI